MAAEYEKKTVAQLQELLKARNLATTGKKAELIARLHDADKSANEAPAKSQAKSDAVEDVIDWDDDATAGEGATKEATGATTEASAATIAAGGQGRVQNPVAVPNQELAEDPAQTDDLHVEADAAKPDADVAASEKDKVEEKPAVDYSIGLQATDLEEELKKRKARAEKFGLVEDATSNLTEADKTLERAKRFGTGESAPAINGLDQALPERARKRGRGQEQGGRGGKRRDIGGRNRNRNHNGPPNKGGSAVGRANEPKPVMSEKDKAAAEARKKRFSAAA